MRLLRPLVLALILLLPSYREGNSGKPAESIMLLWWNVENLFDTRDDPNTADNDFTPQGRLNWTEKKLRLKQLRIAQVFRGISSERANGRYPDIVGFCETENRQVFSGTLAAIPGARYMTAYHESPDRRGIDIGLAWNPSIVTFTGTRAYRVPLAKKDTRDIVVAGFRFSGRPFSVVLNHWPSRVFDREWSEPNRIAAAKVARHIVDSLRTGNPGADIILMGDLNDEPGNRSIGETLGASTERKRVMGAGSRLLYDCWGDTGSPGSYAYRGKWEKIDHIIVSPGLLDSRGISIQPGSFRTYGFPHMFHPSGKRLYSTHEKGKYKGGYSDHLPILIEAVAR